MANMRKKMEEEESSEEEDETSRRERLRRNEQDSDLKHAEDLFENIGLNKNRAQKAVVTDSSDPSKSLDLSSLPLFRPNTKDQFSRLKETLAPLLATNVSKPHYTLFLSEFVKDITKDLPSDQIKKVASSLTALSNEKMKEEKAAEKGGKKTKAKAKATLVAGRDVSSRADTTSYDDDFDE